MRCNKVVFLAREQLLIRRNCIDVSVTAQSEARSRRFSKHWSRSGMRKFNDNDDRKRWTTARGVMVAAGVRHVVVLGEIHCAIPDRLQ